MNGSIRGTQERPYLCSAKTQSIQMLVSQRPKAVLLLADGTFFEGRAIGALGISSGEICFNTGMTGYQEIFTDPSYTGQIMVMASPHIGNYGVKDDEVESNKLSIAGLVVKKFSEVWSRPAGDGSLEDLLKAQGVVGISDVDTRKLVRHIRDHGAQNAIISSTEMDIEVLKKKLADTPDMAGLGLSSKVCNEQPYELGAENAGMRVAVIDFGMKLNIERSLLERDCKVKVFPMHVPLEEMLKWKPDGFLIGNGPGDPGAMPASVDLVKRIVETGIPVFGICLGHQLLTWAMGGTTYKLKFGHHAANHPVKELATGKVEITSQNHGFASDPKSLPDDVEVTHENQNDHTVSGLKHKSLPIFCVQYHPEASPGPHDSLHLFRRFYRMALEHAPSTAK